MNCYSSMSRAAEDLFSSVNYRLTQKESKDKKKGFMNQTERGRRGREREGGKMWREKQHEQEKSEVGTILDFVFLFAHENYHQFVDFAQISLHIFIHSFCCVGKFTAFSKSRFDINKGESEHRQEDVQAMFPLSCAVAHTKQHLTQRTKVYTLRQKL